MYHLKIKKEKKNKIKTVGQSRSAFPNTEDATIGCVVDTPSAHTAEREEEDEEEEEEEDGRPCCPSLHP